MLRVTGQNGTNQHVTTSSIASTPLSENYPESKLTIIGGGIVGCLEAYYGYLVAKEHGKRIRVTIHDKNPTIKDTTMSHLVPNLTPYEILSVVPRGADLINSLRIKFSEPGGIRADEAGINNSKITSEFISAVEEYSKDEEGHHARTEALLMLGKNSMDLWQAIYTHADPELKSILIASNFNPCQELTNNTERMLHHGYRIDLSYGAPNAANRAKGIVADYEKLGYTDCALLSPDEVIKIDPFLKDFCINNSEINEEGLRTWKNDAIAFWRPGGCIDTQVFLPLFYDYLKKVMGQYTRLDGTTKDCFRLHQQRKVEQVTYEETENKPSVNTINGLKFLGNSNIKRNKHSYPQSDYVFCPGEAVGTLRNLGFSEPEYARFAGASLILRIDIPQDNLERYSTLSHHMSVFKNGVSSAWQCRCIANKIFIGLAGTKAFYGDQQPHKNQEFSRNRNLVQLNMINDVLPEFISLAFGKPTQGMKLTETDLDTLERNNIAERWAGSRAVAYDGFPTVGPVYNDRGQVGNARCTTHLGSGGASFAPATILVSRSSMMFETTLIPRDLTNQVLVYGNSQRKGHR